MKNVRFSQMASEDRRKYNAKLLGVLNKIIVICENNNLNWFVSYGSCIGAIRHKGCIPWDDDIDLCMPRPDYDRFIEICRKADLGNYELAILNETPGYYEHIVRMFDKNTTILFDSWHTQTTGIFVDIFPIDGAADGSNTKNQKNLRHFLFWQKISRFSHMVYPKYKRIEILKAGGYLGYFSILLTSLFRTPLQIISARKLDKIMRKYSYENSEYVTVFSEISGLKNVMPKVWLEETILVPFEDMMVRVPKHYDKYLSIIYGDYMTPPPEDKRDDRHVFAFIDMDRNVPLNEIKEILSEN